MQGGNSADLPPPPGTSLVKGEKKEKNLVAPRHLSVGRVQCHVCMSLSLEGASPSGTIRFQIGTQRLPDCFRCR
jgi:hypothetical protein